ncbi:beta-galactosidase [Sphingomonas sp. KR1UV-12]|uniref:Beta-galactosidase n=1 Tax=Sphingomonas aurea TaxID=3063994 RepID=A0ABT9EJD5_9SPHN|nr:beta-galactosidase [Sphingomonas sp. KR1UV-12]MDP1027044.1 beta-galactosidase [Sphingomonas sp. KR1UV-12]
MRLLIAVGLAAAAIASSPAVAQLPDTILYGVAYYDEYTPVDRVEEDARMMKAAGITVVRIAESTWGTLERQPGVFDFSHIDRMLAAMHRQGIKVIVGTPTYAVPTWLARTHPNVLVVTPQGRADYGRRQNMDITDPDYRAASERVIVALIDHVKDHPAVIGYQLDNETKAYNTSGANVQAAFVASMKAKWPSLDGLNKAYGLDYWSNRINTWEDFPSVNGSINASLSNAFAAFQRSLVTDFLAWQAKLVRAHARPGQFLTQNFDLGWRGYSFGIQPEVDHWKASQVLDIAGIDIYHPSQDKLTGAEIAFGGDVTRSMRNGQNYLVLETEAQGFPDWTPYPGQLRLQAFSHLASGAQMVAYWHWATTANAIETYWRGLLSQDYKPNAVYAEASTVGADLKRIGSKLAGMKKRNRVAIYVSNTALSAFDSFKPNGGVDYNQVLRPFYDALYRMNVEVDILSPNSTAKLDDYKLIVVPALYAASDAEIERLNGFAERGGHLLYTFKSGFSDENTKVRYATQPGAIAKAAGVTYQQFTIPEGVTLEGDPFGVGEKDNTARWWMEMLKPTTAKVVARYKHPSWPAFAAITRNAWGRGEVSYIGFMPSDALIEKIIAAAVDRAGVQPSQPGVHFPVIVKSGTLKNGHTVRYVMNYSAMPQSVVALQDGTDLIRSKVIARGRPIDLGPWDVAIIEEDGPGK